MVKIGHILLLIGVSFTFICAVDIALYYRHMMPLFHAMEDLDHGKERDGFQAILDLAQSGHWQAQVKLGRLLALGASVEPNESEALRWLKLGRQSQTVKWPNCSSENLAAMDALELGRYFEALPERGVSAKYWNQVAAELGVKSNCIGGAARFLEEWMIWW